jgi:hypothetical protein
MTNIPTRSRPLLAETFAGLLSSMTEGNELAGLLLQSFPKLTLHRAGVCKGGIAEAVNVINRRCNLFLEGKITELFNKVSADRAAESAARAGRAPSEGPNLQSIKALARAGALSKAVGRFTSTGVMEYNAAEGLAWARQLIPNPPPDSALGARSLNPEETLKLGRMATCAEHFDAAAPILDDEDDDADLEDPGDGGSPDGDGTMTDGGTRTRRKRSRPRPRPGARRQQSSYNAGVHFPALSAPGPSGLRPEHLRAFAASRTARSRQELDDAMKSFLASAIRGTLPPAARWITDSALTFLRKPGADPAAPPRPLRVGETLRRYVAKRIAAGEKRTMEQLFAKRRQFGVACPGGAEILAHYRIQCTEHAALEGDPTTGEWDIDLKNCFGSIFWSAIDTAVEKHIPGALPWTRWCHTAPVRVTLSSGATHLVDRGAEQGDPLGPMYAAAALLEVCERTQTTALEAKSQLGPGSHDSKKIFEAISSMRRRIHDTAPDPIKHILASGDNEILAAGERCDASWVHKWNALQSPPPPPQPPPEPQQDPTSTASAPPANPPPPPAPYLRAFDVWYIDDGYVRASSLDGDLWLAAFDAVGVSAGVERSTAKSSYTSLSHDPVVPPYTSLMCTIAPRHRKSKFLGVHINDTPSQFAKLTEDVEKLHRSITKLDDPAIELLLVRQCAEVSRVTHLLRAIGPTLPPPRTTTAAQPEATPPAPPDPPDPPDPPTFDRTLNGGLEQHLLDNFDALTRRTVDSILRTAVTDEAAQQASWGIKAGGLGLRPASIVALPAHVASLVESAPFIDSLSTQSNMLSLTCRSKRTSHITRMQRTIAALAGDHAPGLQATLAEAIDTATKRAEATAARILSSPPPASARPPRPHASPTPAAPAIAPYTGGSPGIIPDVGEGDSEIRAATHKTTKLQHTLLAHMDKARVTQVLSSITDATEARQKARHRRLMDLSSQDTTHSWLWAINPAHGLVLSNESYLTALRLRLGVPLQHFHGNRPCGECGLRFTAADFGDHVLLCARGQRLIGHNKVRDHLAALARVSDASTEVEVVAHPSTTTEAHSDSRAQRPADILIDAAPLGGAGHAAIDIGITSPHTHEARTSMIADVLEEYKRRKLQKYTDICKARHWTYTPFIISTFARAHTDALHITQRLASAAARTFGGCDTKRTLDAWWRNAATIVMERNARMARTCIPDLDLPPIISGCDEDVVFSAPRRRRLAQSGQPTHPAPPPAPPHHPPTPAR